MTEQIITHCVSCGALLSARTILRAGSHCRACHARTLRPTKEQMARGPRERAVRDRENARLAQLARDAGLG